MEANFFSEIEKKMDIKTLKDFEKEVRTKINDEFESLRKKNKNRRKAIFNWAARGLFFLRGGGGYTHSGYDKTLSATIACNRISCETET